jgi:hypothetical protein
MDVPTRPYVMLIQIAYVNVLVLVVNNNDIHTMICAHIYVIWVR